MALGAVGRDLFKLVVGGGLRMAGLGIAAGALALVGAVLLLERFLEVRDVGWIPFLSSTAVVAMVAAAASYVPAWRASLLSPMVAMREEAGSTWASVRRRVVRVVRDARGAVMFSTPSTTSTPPTLLTEFVAAARAADSFDEALRRALSTLCGHLGVESSVLLERTAEQTFRSRIANGSFAAIAWKISADGFLASRLTAYPLPLPFDRDELDTLAEWAAVNRPERLEEIRQLAETAVRIVVPLRTRTEIMGLLLMGAPRGRERFNPVEKQMLRSCADQFALMLENARLTDRVVGQEALRRDLALAAEVQKRLLPSAPPSMDIAEFAATSVPARSIGGDYYDFIQVGSQRIGIALADVSGKGVAAALIMSVVQASLRIIAADGDISLPRLAARMNDFLYRTTPGNKYATFFYAQVDAGRRQLRYVNAGHNPPYLMRARHNPHGDGNDEPMQELTIGGAVVGMLPGLSYEEATVDLCSGDVLLAYTDGVTEAHDPENVEFGEERLKALLSEVAHLSAEEIRTRISDELKAWIKDAEQYDDLTFVVMKVN
jgi:serine phosphatase RsbU (regulator of sigma subunit)